MIEENGSGDGKPAVHPEEPWRQIALKTENPFFLWLAIHHHLVSQGVGKTDPEELPAEVTIPGWCATYLHAITSNIHDLYFWTLPETGNEEISPAQAIEKLPAALALARPGWNAFTAARSALMKLADAQHFDHLRSNGASAAEAIEALMERRGIVEEASMWRRVSTGRKLMPRRGKLKPKARQNV
jgi:hypothetical protein